MDSSVAVANRSALLQRLYGFCFPQGEESARQVRAVKMEEKGEIRMSEAARWIPFTSEQWIQARQSSFRWEARLATSRAVSVALTDAYEHQRGRVTVKLAGLVPVKKITGPQVDQGELQRYLASILYCPAIFLNHASLECTPAGPTTLRLRDREGPDNATVDLDLDESGHPHLCRAERPRLVGRQSLPTPWMGSCLEHREREGMNVAHRIEVIWQLADGPFTYYRSEVTSFKVLR